MVDIKLTGNLRKEHLDKKEAKRQNLFFHTK